MANESELGKPGMVQIRVKGTLDHKWLDWFDGLAIVPQPGGETLLTGTVIDQSALYGILLKLHNLGLPLLSVERSQK